MNCEVFNGAVIATAYTNRVFIPDTEVTLISRVSPLANMVLAKADLPKDLDPLSPERLAFLQNEMNKHFTHLKEFEHAFYCFEIGIANPQNLADQERAEWLFDVSQKFIPSQSFPAVQAAAE